MISSLDCEASIEGEVESNETGQCEGDILDGGSDNPMYRLLSRQSSRSDRIIETWLLPALVYLGLDSLGNWHDTGYDADNHVSTARWCAQRKNIRPYHSIG
jgi:hypothetical protein